MKFYPLTTLPDHETCTNSYHWWLFQILGIKNSHFFAILFELLKQAHNKINENTFYLNGLHKPLKNWRKKRPN